MHPCNKPSIMQNIGLFFGDLWMGLPLVMVSKIPNLDKTIHLGLAIGAIIIFVRACRKAYLRASA